MANSSPLGWLITPRDLEMLSALAYAPLTARQVAKLSTTWRIPFGATRLVRDRLQRMAAAKLVTSHRYAILHPGQPENYYQLTRDGYRMVHGPDSEPPSKGSCSAIALGRQLHQYALSDFIVHTAWAAHRSDLKFTEFQRENSVRLEAHGHSLYPDCAFSLARGTESYRFFVEIDNSTERVESLKDIDSIERKIRTYDAVQDACIDNRFRVLFVSARNSTLRLQHVLRTAGRVIRDPNRTLVYAITLVEYLAMERPTTTPRFLDHRGDRHCLMPDIKPPTPSPPTVQELQRLTVRC